MSHSQTITNWTLVSFIHANIIKLGNVDMHKGNEAIICMMNEWCFVILDLLIYLSAEESILVVEP